MNRSYAIQVWEEDRSYAIQVSRGEIVAAKDSCSGGTRITICPPISKDFCVKAMSMAAHFSSLPNMG
jgi:hypothetical protein